MRWGRAGGPAARLAGGIGQVLAEPVEPPLDECPALGDPPLGRPQGLHVKAAGSGQPARWAAVPGPWETGPPQDLPRFFAQYYWRLRADFSPGRWTAPLAVLWGGEPAGVQELFGDKYLVNRTTETGSWLARRFQGPCWRPSRADAALARHGFLTLATRPARRAACRAPCHG